ncbi:TetR/AcrR family transcriptional regulator [Undibacter mobilis]|uniref:TetR/AcrR family transcriptional regulator n=1 Tax=Undibacter mobilis TaxID=2292256 RepID=A0A371BB64_9BRAD|nr:TetR/AcrR family transcriptional regulator [Undibacter mobilis]RDV04800.1 TetR/AcrR family transcriptional regulator [Undibacter mobilis]
MVYRTRRRSTERKAFVPPPPRGTSDRDKAKDALVALLMQHSYEEIGLAEVAGRAGLKLSALRAEFGSTLSIWAAHIKDIDKTVLSADTADMAEEPYRERLFDVLMRRIEAMTPYREAVRSMMHSARRNPPLALALNALAVRSQVWMLEAADISASGPRGALRAQGAAVLFARTVQAWLDADDEEASDKAMATLDKGLISAERWDGFMRDLCALPKCILRGPRPRRRRPVDEGAAEASAA